MAERPKTAAEIAEELGKLNEINVEDNITIAILSNKIEGLRHHADDIAQRLLWIIGLIRSRITIGPDTDQAIKQINELYQNALRIGDILSGNAVVNPDET